MAKTTARRTHLASIVDSSDDAILSKTLDGTILSWNRGAERLYGYSADEVIGEPISLLVPEDQRDEVPEILRRIRSGESVDHYETKRVARDGAVIPVSLTVSPIRAGDGRVVAASVIARDVTERKRLDAALAAARNAEREASRLKSEFLATMSHEIRTPMNGVIGMTGLLLETELDREQREYAETVRASGEALLRIIDEILDFSKIEAGRLELEAVDFEPSTVVEDVADLLAESAHSKGLELAVLIEPGIPSRVRGDHGRLRQIVTNLLGNAIKFTDNGEVVARMGLAQETDADALLRIEVTDTGIGVARAKLATLFEPFAQADTSTTRTFGGTGLGLAISKQLAELMGGSIGVESTEGQGSCFWFTARLGKVPRTAPSPRPPRPELRGLRVLIVDDNGTNRTILDRQVSAWGMRSAVAEGTERALQLLRAAASTGEPHDVVLLDMNMAGVNGLDLARRIIVDTALPPTRLLLLTSSDGRGLSAEAREAGFSAFLAKPVRPSRLFDAISMMMGSEGESGGIVTHPTIAAARASDRPPLLVADDNVVNQQVAVAIVRKIGYRADVVANGAEAVEALARTGYAAVLMDCQMPEMDGYQATREIRRREGSDRHTPVIAMTAGALEGDRERCVAAGMDDYISKPVHREKLGAALERWVEREGREQAPGADPGQGGEEGSQTLDQARVAQLRSLQREGEPDILAELIGPFLQAAPAQLAALRAALDSADAQALRQAAHTLKGSSSNLGALRLPELCAELETLAQSGRPAPVQVAVTRIGAEFERLRTALEDELQEGGGPVTRRSGA